MNYIVGRRLSRPIPATHNETTFIQAIRVEELRKINKIRTSSGLLNAGRIHHRHPTRYRSLDRPENGLKTNNVVSQSEDLKRPFSPDVRILCKFVPSSHFVPFPSSPSPQTATNALCLPCVGNIQTGGRRMNESKRGDTGNLMFSLRLFLLASICLAGPFILAHRDALSD